MSISFYLNYATPVHLKEALKYTDVKEELDVGLTVQIYPVSGSRMFCPLPVDIDKSPAYIVFATAAIATEAASTPTVPLRSTFHNSKV
jgi:hypothetical protein